MKRCFRWVLVLLIVSACAVGLQHLLAPLEALRDAQPPPLAPSGPAVRTPSEASRTRLPGLIRAGTASGARTHTILESEWGDLPPGAIPGEYVLTFRSERDRADFMKLARRNGADIMGIIRLGNGLRLRVRDLAQLTRLLAEGPAPLERYSNIYVRLPTEPGKDRRAPDGPYAAFGDRWLEWLGVEGDNDTWGEGIRVAVLDTEVDRHAALDASDVTRIDMRRADVGLVGTSGWHGTAVASLIAGSSDAVRGLAPGAEILGLRVLDEAGQGDAFTLAEAIVEAVDRGAQIVNLSLATPSDSPIVRAAVRYAVERDVLLVAAAGNDGVAGVSYPARYDGVLAVAAVDATGRHVYFSNRGSQVDLAAPAVALSAAGADDSVAAFSGTSAAAPLVAAAAAALMADDPQLSVEDVVEALITNSNDTGAPGQDTETGHGIIDLQRLQYRNVPGIVDAAVCSPYLDRVAEPPRLTLSVQNRGTADLSRLRVSVTVDGEASTFTVEDLAVNQTASRSYVIDTMELAEGGVVGVTLAVTAADAEDIRPGNNAIRTMVGVSVDAGE